MAATFQLSVVTPEREVLAVAARFAAVPAYDGEMGFLPRRAPLLTQLGAGLLRYEDAGGAKRELFVAGGFAQMVDDKLTLLTEEARDPDTVGADLAARSLAEARSLVAGTDAEFVRKDRALQRARALRRLTH